MIRRIAFTIFSVFLVLWTWGCTSKHQRLIEFHQAWMFHADSQVLSIAGERSQLLVVTSHDVYSLDPTHGEVLWRYFSSTYQTIPPLLCNASVIAPFLHTSIIAFSRLDGHLLWKRVSPFDAHTQAHIVSMACDQDTLIVLRWFGPVTAYSLRTGEPMWEYPLSLRAKTNAILYKGMAFVAAMEQGVLILDIKSGALQKQLSPPGNAFYLTIDKRAKRLYVLSMAGKVSYLSIFTPTGTLLKVTSLPWQIPSHSFVLRNHAIYFTTSKNSCVAWSPEEARVLWEYPGEEVTGLLQHPPLVTNNLVFIDDAEHLYVLSRGTGNFIGLLSLKRKPWSDWLLQEYPMPTVVEKNKFLIVPLNETTLAAYIFP